MAAAIGTRAVAINELLTGFSEEPRNIGVTNRQEKALSVAAVLTRSDVAITGSGPAARSTAPRPAGPRSPRG